MPRENIYDEIVDGFRIEVGWAADRYVQIASVNQHSTLTLPCEDLPPQPSGLPANSVTDSAPPGGKAMLFYGWSVTLDRAGLNRLIRTLRRARDNAYGRDE